MEITEAIIARIRELHGISHVGEVIPQNVAFPFVWIGKSGEEYREDLCYPAEIEYVRYDLEVVSTDIDEARKLAAEVKRHLMATPLHSILFINDSGERQTIHGIIVDDHDDNYIPKSPDSEERAYVAAIEAQAIIGELI